jgi:thiamine pyrophosphate-dependent acetolactate synthase large subunit-like protein
MTERRIGGDLVVESLAALGADTVFGEPGQHPLACSMRWPDRECGMRAFAPN